MQIKYAPLIHARTKHIDFRSDFLVKPYDSDFDVKWAYNLVLDSTRFFELSSNRGRRVVFGNGKFVVSGITIKIQDLFQLCNRTPEYHRVDESQNRFAYGFIGVVLPVSAAQKPFDVPFETFLDIYLRYIVPRWGETMNDIGAYKATRVDYKEKDFPAAASVADLDALFSKVDRKLVMDDVFAEREGIAAYILGKALRGNPIAFCSDITLQKAIVESGFDVVTCKNANSILQDIEQSATSSRYEETAVPSEENRTNLHASKSYNEAVRGSQRSKNSKSEKSTQRRNSESYDEIINRLSPPSENVDLRRSIPAGLYNRKNSMHHSSQREEQYSRSKLPESNQPKWSAAESYDDKLNRLSAPSDHIEVESPFISRQRMDETQTGIYFRDVMAGIGIGAGVMVTIIGIATEANPVVLCATGLFSVALSGIEAKRVIDKISNK